MKNNRPGVIEVGDSIFTDHPKGGMSWFTVNFIDEEGIWFCTDDEGQHEIEISKEFGWTHHEKGEMPNEEYPIIVPAPEGAFYECDYYECATCLRNKWLSLSHSSEDPVTWHYKGWIVAGKFYCNSHSTIAYWRDRVRRNNVEK